MKCGIPFSPLLNDKKMTYYDIFTVYGQKDQGEHEQKLIAYTYIYDLFLAQKS